MRKTIIPAAIVLAAPAVTMQAQESTYEVTYEGISRQISEVSSLLGTYPKAVQEEYMLKLSSLQNELDAIKADSELTDKKSEYERISGKVAEVKTAAEADEKYYAAARDLALEAIAEAEKAYSDAATAIGALKVPSVRTDYSDLLKDLKEPKMPTDKELYESKELSNSTVTAWNDYKSSIEKLVSDAESANKTEKDAQPGRQTELANQINIVKGQVSDNRSLVESYVDYSETVKNGHLSAINGVGTSAENLLKEIWSSLEDLELTADKAKEYNTTITGYLTTLNKTAEAALGAALAKAEADAEALVEGLTECGESDLDDGYTKEAKKAAKAAIAKAKDAAEKLAGKAVQAEYDEQKNIVDAKVSTAKELIAAVEPLVKNYAAYSKLKTTYVTLKAAYDDAAIQLSTLKANGDFYAQFYNEANTQLNVVAQMLETFAQTNQAKYEGKAYSDGVDGTVYAKVLDLLKEYNTADKIQEIVDKAVDYNDTLAKLTDYQTQVDDIEATVSHENVNYADPDALKKRNDDLGAQKTALAKELAGLVTDYRTNKTLGKTTDEIKQEIFELITAIATAQTDLNAYVSSKEQVATWTATVGAILEKIPNPVSQDYTAHKDLEDDRSQATGYQSAISQLGIDADNVFMTSPGKSQEECSVIQSKDYTNLLKTLSDSVDTHLGDYKTWLDEQGDVAAYKLGLKYCEELKALLDAAEVAAPGALGFTDDRQAIKTLGDEVEKTHTPGHKFNDCIAAMESWKKTYDSIKQSIADHQKAWQINKEAYDNKLDSLTGILDFEAEAPQLNLYTKLNDTNRGIIDTAISNALTALDEANNKQEASLFDAAKKQTEILDMIAQLKLQEELDASLIATAITTVRNKLATNEGWNPNDVYSTQLDNLIKTEYTPFTVGVKYAEYQTKSGSIDGLKKDVEAVAINAEANYKAYNDQKKAQTDAKAVWADIYSKVGAMYVDATGQTDFSRAQKFYQDELNKCFTKLTGYDTQIEEAYKAGTSALFSTKDYEAAIAENKTAMEAIHTHANANKVAYDGQMKKFGKLETDYSEQQEALKTLIANVVKSIDGATDAEKKELEEQQKALETAQTKLGGVQTTINELKNAVVEAVNARKSAIYDYDTEDRSIRTTISDIISTAEGKYNQNIKDHNAVVRTLFLNAYNAAKKAYNEYTFSIEKYAGFKHALDEKSGVSAYAAEIEKAQKAIFTLNTQLVAKYNEVISKFDSTTEYFDKTQEHKADVNELKKQLDKAYEDFLDATKKIADDKYDTPLSDLADYYNEAKETIMLYDIIKDITPDEKKAAAVAKYFYFDGKELDGTALYDTYTKAGNKGPQQLDALRAQVEGQKANVLTAWNNAAQKEAEAAKDKALTSYNSYNDNKKYPEGYAAWKTALATAQNAIKKAGTDITTSLGDKTLNADVVDIKKALTDAISALETANNTAETDCETALSSYKTYSENIEQLKKNIAKYTEHKYFTELTDSIEVANQKAVAYENANEDAFNALYQDTKVLKALSDAETAAYTALQNLQEKAKELEKANQPAGIVNTLLAKAQELVPLYNRAEANAKGIEAAEKVCAGLRDELNTLLTTLGTTDDSEKEKIANNKGDYEDRIKNLRERIIAADREQVAYTDLLNMQADVAKELEAVKTTIDKNDLKTTFSAKTDEIDASLSAAATQINIDHANNLCGKEGAYTLEQLGAISTKISELSTSVDAEIARLAKAEADKATRDANTEAYNKANSAIKDLLDELESQWEYAQKQYVDVYALYADTEVKDLQDAIAKLQTSLKAAFDAAQVDPIKLDTSDYATDSYYTSIETLMGKIRDRQAKFDADVKYLNGEIAKMKEAFEDIVVPDIAAADPEVQKKQAEIETKIAAIETAMKKENFGPDDKETVLDMIKDANDKISEFKLLVERKDYVPGDITGTGSVDINDTFKILDLILENLSGDELDEKAQKAADMDGDGKFTVADLVQINNLYVYDNKTGQQGSNRVAAAADAEVGSVDMQLDTDRMSVLLDSNTGYSAIQMDVEMPQGVSINEVNFAGDSQKVMVATNTLENGVQRIVIYSTDGSSILNGETSLINLGLAGEGMGIVGIDNIIASTAAGQRHNLMGVTGAYTIVTGIEATETAEGNTSVFDINGMVRKTVQKGVNIVKDAAGKVKKMLMK